MSELWIKNFPAGSQPHDFHRGRIAPEPIAFEQWWEAIDAVPGARIGPSGVSQDHSVRSLSVTEEAMFAVEVYDPDLEAWRQVITLANGDASISAEVVGNRQSATCSAAERLARVLDASIVTDDGDVLMWRGAWADLQ